MLDGLTYEEQIDLIICASFIYRCKDKHNAITNLSNSGFFHNGTYFFLLIRKLIKYGILEDIDVLFCYDSLPENNDNHHSIKKYTKETVGDNKIDSPGFDEDTFIHSYTLEEKKKRKSLGFISYIETMRENIKKKKQDNPSFYTVQGDLYGEVRPQILINKVNEKNNRFLIDRCLDKWLAGNLKPTKGKYIVPLNQIQIIVNSISHQITTYGRIGLMLDHSTIKGNYNELSLILTILFLESKHLLEIKNFELPFNSRDYNIYINILDSFDQYKEQLKYEIFLSQYDKNTFLYCDGEIKNNVNNSVRFSGKSKSFINLLCENKSDVSEEDVSTEIYGDQFLTAKKIADLMSNINKECKKKLLISDRLFKKSNGIFYINPIFSIISDKKR